MRHVSFTLATLHVDDVEMELLSADLLVVQREETVELDWELIATSLPTSPFDAGTYRLVMAELLDGRVLSGEAIMVRSDTQRHVFRGRGNLSGLRVADGLGD